MIRMFSDGKLHCLVMGRLVMGRLVMGRRVMGRLVMGRFVWEPNPLIIC